MTNQPWVFARTILLLLCLASWAHAVEGKAASKEGCGSHCFLIDRMQLEGNLADLPLRFTVEGHVLSAEPQLVSLFGPPERARLEDVRLGGARAIIGFEKGYYFVLVPKGHFSLKGTLAVAEGAALSIPGPVNTFEARITGGRIVEGSMLSGLSGATLHFEIGRGDTEAKPGEDQERGPTIFQLSRALRIRKQIDFEYKLDIRSGAEIGMVELPLAFGERVLEVQGAEGWRVEKRSLLLPTTNRQAEITVTGTLPKLGRFAADPRSNHEWWLLEADAEHRLFVDSAAQRIDVKESPIKTQTPTARLYLLKPGQALEVSAKQLAGAPVLAAIVVSQDREAVITETGDIVYQDDLTYENNGVDYLPYTPHARPIYMATDGKAERIMYAEGRTSEVMIPLLTGNHRARIQSIGEHHWSRWLGRLELPGPTHSLTASSATLHIGLPATIVPLAMLGGDKPEFAVGIADLVAAVFGFLVGWVLLRRGRGAVAGLLLGSAWFFAAPVYVLVLVGLGLWGALVFGKRFLQGRFHGAITVMSVLGAAGVALLLVGLLLVGTMSSRSRPSFDAAPYGTASVASKLESGRSGDWAAAKGGVLEGITPIALPMPDYDRSVSIRREFVSKGRPFRPVVYYATEWVCAPLIAAWAILALWFFWVHRTVLRARLATLRTRFFNQSEEAGQGEVSPETSSAAFPGPYRGDFPGASGAAVRGPSGDDPP